MKKGNASFVVVVPALRFNIKQICKVGFVVFSLILGSTTAAFAAGSAFVLRPIPSSETTAHSPSACLA